MTLGFAYRARIKNIEVLGPYKVRFNLNMPAPDLWKRLWWNGAIMPKKYREQVGDAGFADKPIGSGPFKWVDYKQDQFFTMEAVPNHHRKTPEFKTLKIVYVQDNSTRLAMLKAGEADIIAPDRTAYSPDQSRPESETHSNQTYYRHRPWPMPISPSRKKKAPSRISGFGRRPAWPLIARGSATKCSLAEPNLMAR